MLASPESVAAIVAEVAAEELMPRFRHLASGDVRDKGPGDPVTVADEAAERALTRRLAGLLPGSLVVGEEAASADPAVVDRLSQDNPVWIIDPVDGTTNFAAACRSLPSSSALPRAGACAWPASTIPCMARRRWRAPATARR